LRPGGLPPLGRTGSPAWIHSIALMDSPDKLSRIYPIALTRLQLLDFEKYGL